MKKKNKDTKEKIITPKQFYEQMKVAFGGDDIESNHSAGDDVMCELLKSLGYNDGVKVFEDADKWYA